MVEAGVAWRRVAREQRAVRAAEHVAEQPQLGGEPLELRGVEAGRQHPLDEAAEAPEGLVLAQEEQQRRREEVHALAVADGGVAVRVGVEHPRHAAL